MKKFVVLVMFGLLGLNGCATLVKNSRDAKLMPREIATSILVTYAGADWVANPRGRSAAYLCTDEYPMPYSAINKVVVAPNQKGLLIYVWNWDYYPCGKLTHYEIRREKPLEPEEIDDIVDALVSMGAKIDEISR